MKIYTKCGIEMSEMIMREAIKKALEESLENDPDAVSYTHLRAHET